MPEALSACLFLPTGKNYFGLCSAPYFKKKTLLFLYPPKMQEASMMVAVRHENVVRCLGICAVPPCIVTEFCPRGSLFNLLQAARGSPEVGAALGWARRLRMVVGMELQCRARCHLPAAAGEPCTLWLLPGNPSGVPYE